MKGIFKVVGCGEVVMIRSDKSNSGQLAKRNMILQEFGGKYEDEFLVSLLGNDAQCHFFTGDVVLASLQFSIREHNGQAFQNITVQAISKLSMNP